MEGMVSRFIELVLQQFSKLGNNRRMLQLDITSEKGVVPLSEGRKGRRKKDSDSLKQGEESFEPENLAGRMATYHLNKRKCKVGEWSYQENQVYLQFIIDNSIEFSTETSRRRGKVFFRLSKILKRRTPDQCRSHHQKLQIKFKDDLVAIINEVYRKIQKTMVQEYFDYHHRLHLPQALPAHNPAVTSPPSNAKDAGSREEALVTRRETDREWVGIEQVGNAFRVTIREEVVGVYGDHP